MSKIAEFQEKHGLVSDGQLGKKTFAKMKEVWKLTNEQLAHFLGQTNHESAGFTVSQENLNYSKDGLMRVFKTHFTPETAELSQKKPQIIANTVYASRYGNGVFASGDGYKYRGRGAIQTTFKDNYKAFSDFIKEDCVDNPDLVSGKYFFESAIFFFAKNGIFKWCNNVSVESITKVTKRINGGTNGLPDRMAKTMEYYKQIIK